MSTVDDLGVPLVPLDVLATWPAEARETYLAEIDALAADLGIYEVPHMYDPAGWAQANIVGLELAVYQYDIFDLLKPEDGEKGARGAAKGPRGLGKTTAAAVVILWFAKTREQAGIDWKCATTSGSWGQLRHYLWPEVHKINRMLRNPLSDKVLLDMGIKGEYGNAFAASPAKADLIEGIHADSVLILFDESKIIRPELFDSIEGAAMNAESQETFMLAVSTPGDPLGRFYDLLTHKPGFEQWRTRSVSKQEAIDAGRLSESEAERLKKAWGETSSLYRNHVLGEFASDDELSLIPTSWIEAAQQRWLDNQHVPDGNRWRFGLDVARHGRDHTVLAGASFTTAGWRVNQLWAESYTDNTIELAEQIAPKVQITGGVITVDADGMGTGAADHLRLMPGVDAVPFFGGAKSKWRDRSDLVEAFNTRSAAWFSLKEMLDPAHNPTLMLPPDDGLKGDLAAVRQRSHLSGTQLRIEDKEKTAKRIGRSPDRADAVVMALWDEPPGPAKADEWSSGGYGDGGTGTINW